MAPASEMTHVDKRKAQAAYSALDVDASAATHATRVSGGHDEDHSNVGSRLKTLVFGGLDGILTSFAIVSSCAGSEMDARVVGAPSRIRLAAGCSPLSRRAAAMARRRRGGGSRRRGGVAGWRRRRRAPRSRRALPWLER